MAEVCFIGNAHFPSVFIQRKLEPLDNKSHEYIYFDVESPITTKMNTDSNTKYVFLISLHNFFTTHMRQQLLKIAQTFKTDENCWNQIHLVFLATDKVSSNTLKDMIKDNSGLLQMTQLVRNRYVMVTNDELNDSVMNKINLLINKQFQRAVLFKILSKLLHLIQGFISMLHLTTIAQRFKYHIILIVDKEQRKPIIKHLFYCILYVFACPLCCAFYLILCCYNCTKCLTSKLVLRVYNKII